MAKCGIARPKTKRPHRVISDATSVQPLSRSHVDLKIIGLVAEEVEAEVAVGGVEDLRNL